MTDIAHIFATDPLELTREDLTEIVKKLREARGQFNLGSMKAGRVKAPTSARGKAVAELKSAGLSLNLTSLLNQKGS